MNKNLLQPSLQECTITASMFILEKIIATVAPHLCIVCGVEGTVLCAWCLPGFAPPVPERCYRCKAQTKDSKTCQKCRRTSKLGHVWVTTTYEDRAKQLVHDYKFARKQAASEPIARMMAVPLPYLSRDTIITHLPTASSRVRRRGYDHAALLARALAAQLDLPYVPLLCRVTQTRQVGASRKERLQQLQTAFESAGPLYKARVLVVDDIVTTGGTLEAAAGCLRKSGARHVSAVVFAQKQ